MENIFCAEALNGMVQVNPLAERPVSQAGIAMRPSGEPSGASADLWFIDTAIGPNASDAAGAATPGTKLAVKVMRHGCAAPHKEALESNEAYKADWYKLRQEYETLRSMDGAQGHAPVAYALGWRIKKTPRGEVRYPALVMEYVEGVDIVELRGIMSDAHGEVCGGDVLDTARSIVTALLCCTVVSREDARYLTTVSHRDLSSHNLRFMLDKDGQRIERVMLIDFGQSAQNDDPDVTAADGSERLSTPFIGAPEIFDQRQSEVRQWRNTSHADCYSIGCLLYYLRCGVWPHEAQIRTICAQSSGGLNAAELQELFELKNNGAIHLDGTHCVDDDDRTLDELIARCTEPGIGKIGGRFDVIRLAERLGIDENGKSLTNDAPEATSPAEESTPHSKSPFHKKRLATIASCLCAVAVVAAIAVAIAFATGALGTSQENDQLVLYPTTALSAGQLRESVELVQARLDVAGLGKASTIESMDGICVDFSAGAFDVPDELDGGESDSDSSQASSSSESSDTASVSRSKAAQLLSRPLELYLACMDSKSTGFTSYEHIYRTEIKDVTVKTGKVEGLEPLAPDDPDRYVYLELTLTDSANKRLKESCGDWLDQGALAFDVEGSTWDVVSTVSLGKGRYAFTADLLAPSQTLCEVLAKALLSESYRTSFRDSLVPQATWIDSDFTGDNQVKQSVLEDSGTLVSFTSYDTLSRGERVDALEALAARLDTLGVPYSLGDTSDGKGIVAQIQGLDLGETAVRLICANPSIEVFCGLQKHVLRSPAVEAAKTSTGAAVRVSDGDVNGKAGMNAVTQAAADAGGAWVYLGVGGIPIMRTWVSAASTQLTFDISCASGKPLDTSNKYLADLAAVVATTDPPFMRVDYCGRMDLALSSAPGSLEAEVDEARHAIKAAFPSALVGTSAYDDTELLVSLDLTVDDTFAQKTIDTVETLYNAMDFDSTPFDQVTFCLAGESGDERARIWFMRCDGAGGQSGHVAIDGSIRGGRFEEQRQRVIDAAEANSFFQEHTDDQSSWLL
mgnify:CR=1 FL=1